MLGLAVAGGFVLLGVLVAPASMTAAFSAWATGMGVGLIALADARRAPIPQARPADETTAVDQELVPVCMPTRRPITDRFADTTTTVNALYDVIAGERRRRRHLEQRVRQLEAQVATLQSTPTAVDYHQKRRRTDHAPIADRFANLEIPS